MMLIMMVSKGIIIMTDKMKKPRNHQKMKNMKKNLKKVIISMKILSLMRQKNYGVPKNYLVKIYISKRMI